jgi:uncharacterized membrane-anchored protein
MKKILIPVFIVVALAQWVVPGSMMWNREGILREGKIFLFETEPVDPSNPFKGKYISLRFKESEITIPTSKETFKDGQKVYVVLKVENGFAGIQQLSAKKPSADIDYITASVWYASIDSSSTTIHIKYPFEEYYMNEDKAPKAEEVYFKSLRDTTHKTYAQVKVLKGETVIEDVFIGKIPIEDLINQ